MTTLKKNRKLDPRGRGDDGRRLEAEAETHTRFNTHLTRLTGARPGRIGLAVSGGADSLALLLLAARAFPGQVEAATVDHRLRPTSTAEAEFVADICATIDVPHATLKLAPLPPGNVSAAARDARYAALHGWADAHGLDRIATAHHADDQLETLVMRLNRGSGVGGLAGIRAVTGRIVRPLLGWRRAELAKIVAAAGITPIDDPSNRDDRYDRARLRKRLADADWLDPAAAARTATNLADANAALDWVVDSLWKHWCDGRIALDWPTLPIEIVRRIVTRAIVAVDPACRLRGDTLGHVVETLLDGGIATVGSMLCDGRESAWRFTPAPPRRTTR